MKRRLQRLALPISIIAALLLGFSLLWIPCLIATHNAIRQIAVVADFQAYERALDRFHTAHGAYPLQLSEAIAGLALSPTTDRWGSPLIYLSDGSFFVLVGTGKGGRPDEGENYISARAQAPRRYRDPGCSDPRIDQILTDRGWYRGCGK